MLSTVDHLAMTGIDTLSFLIIVAALIFACCLLMGFLYYRRVKKNADPQQMSPYEKWMTHETAKARGMSVSFASEKRPSVFGADAMDVKRLNKLHTRHGVQLDRRSSADKVVPQLRRATLDSGFEDLYGGGGGDENGDDDDQYKLHGGLWDEADLPHMMITEEVPNPLLLDAATAAIARGDEDKSLSDTGGTVAAQSPIMRRLTMMGALRDKRPSVAATSSKEASAEHIQPMVASNNNSMRPLSGLFPLVEEEQLGEADVEEEDGGSHGWMQEVDTTELGVATIVEEDDTLSEEGSGWTQKQRNASVSLHRTNQPPPPPPPPPPPQSSHAPLEEVSQPPVVATSGSWRDKQTLQDKKDPKKSNPVIIGGSDKAMSAWNRAGAEYDIYKKTPLMLLQGKANLPKKQE
jgi:hypothetical protein